MILVFHYSLIISTFHGNVKANKSGLCIKVFKYKLYTFTLLHVMCTITTANSAFESLEQYSLSRYNLNEFPGWLKKPVALKRIGLNFSSVDWRHQ